MGKYKANKNDVEDRKREYSQNCRVLIATY